MLAGKHLSPPSEPGDNAPRRAAAKPRICPHACGQALERAKRAWRQRALARCGEAKDLSQLSLNAAQAWSLGLLFSVRRVLLGTDTVCKFAKSVKK